MLIGAHVSTAGGLSRAIERATERDCDAIQIFNQSPRMWRPTGYDKDDFAEFRRSMADSKVESVVIHAIYLLNCAAGEKEVREKSIHSLTHALRVGDEIGADGVVLHAGAQKTDRLSDAIRRSSGAIKRALRDSDRCPLLIENMAGHKGLLGREFSELATLIERSGGGRRLGVCLDSCHLLAAGWEVRTPEGLAETVDAFDAAVGLKRLRCLHVNDSKMALGSERDRHASIGKGEIGRAGFRTFLSEPRFERLPALLETPGPDGHGPDRAEVRLTKRLRREGLEKRG
jgi:deoxyribonuclease IV